MLSPPTLVIVMLTMKMLEKLRNAEKVPPTIIACNDEQLLRKLQLPVMLLTKQSRSGQMCRPCHQLKYNILLPSQFPSPETSCILTRTMFYHHMISILVINTILLTLSHK